MINHLLRSFFVTNVDTAESFNSLDVFDSLDIFIILVLIRCIFLSFWWNDYFFNISWILINYMFCFRNFVSDFPTINSPVASSALWSSFMEAVFRASSLVSNNCFLHLLEKFIANDKSPYPLTYFLVLGSIEYRVISIY